MLLLLRRLSMPLVLLPVSYKLQVHESPSTSSCTRRRRRSSGELQGEEAVGVGQQPAAVPRADVPEPACAQRLLQLPRRFLDAPVPAEPLRTGHEGPARRVGMPSGGGTQKQQYSSASHRRCCCCCCPPRPAVAAAAGGGSAGAGAVAGGEHGLHHLVEELDADAPPQRVGVPPLVGPAQ